MILDQDNHTHTQNITVYGEHITELQDEWMLEQYDGVEPERTDFVNHPHSGLRNPNIHFFKRDHLNNGYQD